MLRLGGLCGPLVILITCDLLALDLDLRFIVTFDLDLWGLGF